MTKYPNITITFTIIPDDVTLKVQATCDSMSKGEVLMALDKLKTKIESGDFDTFGTESPFNGGYYSENTFPLHEPNLRDVKIDQPVWLMYTHPQPGSPAYSKGYISKITKKHFYVTLLEGGHNNGPSNGGKYFKKTFEQDNGKYAPDYELWLTEPIWS